MYWLGVSVLQLVVVALIAMAFQLDLVRRVCRQRMACFSVFLALPSATIRTMATVPCQVRGCLQVLAVLLVVLGK
jgi:hypothetical protein